MIPSLSQEALTQYASDAQTIQEPTGADYSRGVSVGRTIPAKWWNWLFSNATKRIVQSRNDADNMLTELKNAVTDAGLTPSASDSAQLKQAIEAKADEQIHSYVDAKASMYITKWEAATQLYLDGVEWNPNVGEHKPSIVRSDRYGAVFVSYVYGVSSITSAYMLYSFDGVHWFSVMSGRIDNNIRRCFMLGTYLFSVLDSGISRADISGGGIVQAQNISFSQGLYNGVVIPFSDSVYCFWSNGILYKLANNSTTPEVIDSSHLGQVERASGTGMIYVNEPVKTANGYIIGNVHASLDLSVWEHIVSIPSSASYDDFSIVSKGYLLRNGSVAITAGAFSTQFLKYYVMDTQGNTQLVTTSSIIAQNVGFTFKFGMGGYAMLSDSRAGYHTGTMFSSDGINFNNFNFSVSSFCYTDECYYVKSSNNRVYISREGLSADAADYSVIENVLDGVLRVFTGGPYVAVVSRTTSRITTPLGNYDFYTIYQIIKRNKTLPYTPQMIWPDGTVTELYCNSDMINFAVGKDNLVGLLRLDGSSSLDPFLTLNTAQSINYVQGHTLYLR